MWTWFNDLFFFPHKATSVSLPPLFVFRPKFELSLEFTQRQLVHQQKFLLMLLVGSKSYPAYASRLSYKLYKGLNIVRCSSIQSLDLFYAASALGNRYRLDRRLKAAKKRLLHRRLMASAMHTADKCRHKLWQWVTLKIWCHLERDGIHSSAPITICKSLQPPPDTILNNINS